MTDQPARQRLESIDVVRGVIMILMALDHTRDFFGVPGLNPVNIAQTTPALFFTRWITHICAPVFFLLMGTSAFLSLRRRTQPALARLLLTRGLWLVVLEVTVLRCLAYQFNFDYHVTMLVVLWALGWCLIALSALVFLPPTVVAIIGVVMIVTHNLFDPITAASLGAFGPIWSLLHAPGFVNNRPGFVVFVAYPLVPWIGVTAVGYGLGQLYRGDAVTRQRVLLRLGLALMVAFVLVRFANVYGDPAPWQSQPSAIMTLVSFFNVTKYPPSLSFLLMTLGPALVFLSLMERNTPRWLRPALVFGHVPLFYFVLHFTLIHLLAVVVALVNFGDASGLFASPTLAQYPFTAPPGWGFSLPGVYVWWMVVVILMYPACVWFARLKARRDDWWLSYL
jgi:uncharacterized membrane protein